MQSDSRLSPPESSAGDKIHALVRAGIGSVPVVGSAGVELFQALVAPPFEKRRQAWMETVGEGLKQLEEKQGKVLEELQANDAFVDTVMQASQAALRTSKQEKLDALRNAVLNSALPSAPDESKREIFINWVDSFTVWHLKMLRLLSDPRQWYRDHDRKPPDSMLTTSLEKTLIDAYPELRNEQALYDKIAADLYSDGLLNTEGLRSMMSPDGAMQSRTTELGNQFLQFIMEPKS